MSGVSPSPSEIDAIAALAEPIFRNLKITLAYSHVSQAFAAWCPGGANWCTFATWASRQAGCTIRKEDLARAVARRLGERLEHRPILREVHRAFGISGGHLLRIVGELSQACQGSTAPQTRCLEGTGKCSRRSAASSRDC